MPVIVSVELHNVDGTTKCVLGSAGTETCGFEKSIASSRLPMSLEASRAVSGGNPHTD